MPTHVDIDDRLLEQVIELGNFSTRRAAVHAALTHYLKTLKRQELLALRGKVTWDAEIDRIAALKGKAAEFDAQLRDAQVDAEQIVSELEDRRREE